jgi:hypothetical protein
MADKDAKKEDYGRKSGSAFLQDLPATTMTMESGTTLQQLPNTILPIHQERKHEPAIPAGPKIKL